MHAKYDDAADCGQDQPVFVVSPANKKALRISSEGRCKQIRSMVFLINNINFVFFVTSISCLLSSSVFKFNLLSFLLIIDFCRFEL